MRYMLMMNAPRGTGDYAVNAWSPDDLKAHIGFMFALNKELSESGELVGAEGLAWPDSAKFVRSDGVQPPVITDGPFAESKEFLAGFWIVDVDTEARAIEIAATASAAPGPAGEPIRQVIEVRAVMEAPDVSA